MMATISLLFPFYFLHGTIDKYVFSACATYITVTYIFVCLIVTFVSWQSFLLWWKGKDELLSKSNENEFVIPVIAHFIRTFGKWIALWKGRMELGVALVLLFFIGFEEDAEAISSQKNQIVTAISMIPVGFLIVITTQFVSEKLKAITTIANNTKK
jgi:hypothetical protein